MINTHRTPRLKRGNRVDPSVVHPPRKIEPVCLACATQSRVAKHTHH